MSKSLFGIGGLIVLGVLVLVVMNTKKEPDIVNTSATLENTAAPAEPATLPTEPTKTVEPSPTKAETKAKVAVSTPTTPTVSTSASVTYTNTGFSPSSLTVKTGTTVKFTNQADTDMWVAADPHPIHSSLAGFDERSGAQIGESYSFTFSKTGTFGYHNHLNASETGTITVTN